MHRLKKLYILLAAVLIIGICLSGCGSKGESEAVAQEGKVSGEEDSGNSQSDEPVKEENQEDKGPYEAPAFADSGFHEEQADDNGIVQMDISSLNKGYVAVSCTADSRLKFQVLKDDATYNYDMESDGTPAVFPLQCGDGSYEFRVMENVVDNKYAELYSTVCDVELEDEFQPFIRPSNYVSYNQESACVKKAEELALTAGDALGLVHEVYDYICDNVSYDKDKARNVKKGYLPNPDETLESGTGICFDYASLAAAMLRSQGIPTKVIFGYVSPDDLYHAWNMFYTEETGWVTVKYEVKGDNWNRLDLTFAANGADGDFIGNGSNYTDVLCY